MSGLVLPMPGMGGTGMVPVMNLAQMQAEEKKRTELTQAQPLVQGLAAHVQKCFDAARTAKQQTMDERLLKCVRQRRGEYDPDVLTGIKKSGGSEIYMMLTANKCRAAASWIKDVMLGTRDQLPWDVEPTRNPTLSPQDTQEVATEATQEAMQIEAQLGGMEVMTPARMHELVERVHDKRMAKMRDEADEIMRRMRDKMEDQLQEGGYFEAFSAFVDDLVTFPFAVIKGPVPRKKQQLQWLPTPDGQFKLDVKEEIQLCWDRVDPFMLFWAPHATKVEDGYIVERHKLTRGDLQELVGVDGYDENAIRAVLEEHGRGGLNLWLTNDATRLAAQGKSVSAVQSDPEPTIDALQFWGSVQGSMLVEWGMDKAQVPDPLKEYSCEVWVIGRWVIKAVLNADPCGRKPYYKTSYEEIPGSWAGNGVADLARDCQDMCNGSARALANNMGIASGPQTYVNVDRLPAGEDVTQMYPWRIWQVTSDPYGGTAKPVDFFQPNSNAQELMAIYEKFSVLADEYTGIPRYMTGDTPAGGAGRTASGMSMLMNNAGKSLKQVIGNIDLYISEPLIDRLYYYNMKYGEDPVLKGDVRVVARGMNVLVAKEAAQVRMNEILNIVASNPLFIDIVGEEAIADLLREVTKPLNMDIVPSKEEIRARMVARQQAAMVQQAAAAMAAQGPAGVNFERDPHGALTGVKVMPGNKQRLQNGAPVTDNFAPSRKG